MNDRLAEYIVKNRLALFAISCLILLASSSGIYNFNYQRGLTVFLPQQGGELENYNRLKKEFTSFSSAVFIVENKQADLINKESIDLVYQLSDHLESVPFVNSVTSLTHYQRLQLGVDEADVFSIVEDVDALDSEALRSIRSRVVRDNNFYGSLISEDLTTTLIVATLDLESEAIEDINLSEWSEETSKAIGGPFKNHNVFAASEVLADHAVDRVSADDLLMLYPIVILAGSVVVFLLFGSIYSVLAGFVVVTMSMAASFGATLWAGFELNMATSLSFPMIFLLAFSNVIHLLVTLSIRLPEANSKEEAIISAYKVNLKSIFLACVTTCIGFLGLNTTASPAFQDMGNIVSLGMVFVLVFLVGVLPALIYWMPVDGRSNIPALKRWSRRYLDMILHERRYVMIAFTLIILAVVGFYPGNVWNDDPKEYLDEKLFTRQSAELLEEKFFSINNFTYTGKKDLTLAVNEPEQLAQLAKFQAWLEQQPEVVSSNSLLNVIYHWYYPDQPTDWNAINSQTFVNLEDNAEIILALLEEVSLANANLDEYSLTVNLVNMPSENFLSFIGRVDAWLSENAPELQLERTGLMSMFISLSKDVVISVAYGTAAVFAIVSIIILMGVGSLRYGLISALPNVLPGVVVYVGWAYYNGEINMPTSITFCISLGIIVDATIHIVNKYLRGIELGMTIEDALKYMIETAGIPILMTSIVMITGLFVLSFSLFSVNQTISVAMISIFVAALLLDLLLLPVVLYYFDRSRVSLKLPLESQLRPSLDPAVND